MIKVGITGNIGSGKTTVSGIFETLGVPVYCADTEAKRILDSPVVTKKVCKVFGYELLGEKGIIDRKKLASRVFTAKETLEKLNAIIHPIVREDFICWMGLHHSQPYVLYEAAILLETGFAVFFNRIIVVTAPEATRLQRVAARDHVKLSDVKQRIDNQWPDEEKRKHADYVINNGGEQLLIPQVINVHKEILNLL